MLALFVLVAVLFIRAYQSSDIGWWVLTMIVGAIVVLWALEYVQIFNFAFLTINLEFLITLGLVVLASILVTLCIEKCKES